MDIASLIAGFGGLAWTLAAFVVALSIIVAVHEYGHYIVGRWTGIDAEVFSIGFGPVLFARTDRRGTRWQLAALPFGGYVKFVGDANAASVGASEAEMIHLPPERRGRTMQAAPLWARAATVAAGPAFNLVLSALIFAGVSLFEGRPAEPLTVGAVRALPAGPQELREGDVVRAVGGLRLPQEGEAEAEAALDLSQIPPAASVPWTVEREGREVTVPGPHPRPPIVLAVQPQSAALAADLRPGDVIVAVDGAPTLAFEEVREAVEASGGAPLRLDVWRGGEAFETTLAPRRVDVPTQSGFETRWLLGITGGLAVEPATVRAGPVEAIRFGAAQTAFIVESSLRGMWSMLTGAISSCNLSGPIGIAQVSGTVASQGAQSFVWFIAVLSTAVGLLNLFPIPVLDGGHLVFHAWEAVTGRAPSDRALRVLMGAGLAILLSLMAFALFNDVVCP